MALNTHLSNRHDHNSYEILDLIKNTPRRAPKSVSMKLDLNLGWATRYICVATTGLRLIFGIISTLHANFSHEHTRWADICGLRFISGQMDRVAEDWNHQRLINRNTS